MPYSKEITRNVDAAVSISLLGPMRVLVHGRSVDPRAGRLRVLLAALALHAGKPVSNDRLAMAVWGDELPDSPRRSLHTYVTRLRGVLGGHLIGTRADGYLLDVPPDQVDVLRFGHLLDRVEAVPDMNERRRRLEAALALWRGDPFQGLRSTWLDSVVAPRLTERRLAAIEARVDLDLIQGRDGGSAELQELTALHPLRESLWQRLLLLLAHSGRPGEALARYEVIRARLADELGTDPGSDLREIHAQLLAGTIRAPTRLPVVPAGFVGRVAELAEVVRVHREGAASVTVIGGMPGVGKTALALHAMHDLVDDFPDGQLVVDLHGYTRRQDPMEPADALERMLRALGTPRDDIPRDVEERAALYQSRLVGRRMLILLDNAADDLHVEPLLPRGPECHVLITSTRRMTGLGRVHRIVLEGLSKSEAVALIQSAMGQHRPNSTSIDDVLDVARLCGCLPLALQIAVARLRSHPAWSPADLARRLRRRHRRLAELDDGHRSVAAALELSYRQLPDDQRRAYWLLGMQPGKDASIDAVAALTGTTALGARLLLEDLLEAGLVQEFAPDRYRQHMVAGLHAAATAARQDDTVRSSALDRLLDYYVGTASAAMDVAYPYERDRRPAISQCGVTKTSFHSSEAAVTWLDAELPNLLAAARHAADHGRPDRAISLSAVLAEHLRTRSRYAEAAPLHDLALVAARTTGDRYGQLRALLALGDVHRHRDRIRPAFDCFTEALALARDLGEGGAELDALTYRGHLYRRNRRLTAAAEQYDAALHLARGTDHRLGEVDASTGLGRVRLLQGRYRQAIEIFLSADGVARAIGYRTGALRTAAGLGDGYRCLGDYPRSAVSLERALTTARESGDRYSLMKAWHGLGRLHQARGQAKQAIDHHRLALHLAVELGRRVDEAHARSGLAEAHLACGQDAAARRHRQTALSIFTSTGFDVMQGDG